MATGSGGRPRLATNSGGKIDPFACVPRLTSTIERLGLVESKWISSPEATDISIRQFHMWCQAKQRDIQGQATSFGASGTDDPTWVWPSHVIDDVNGVDITNLNVALLYKKDTVVIPIRSIYAYGDSGARVLGGRGYFALAMCELARESNESTRMSDEELAFVISSTVSVAKAARAFKVGYDERLRRLLERVRVLRREHQTGVGRV
jgi:hypothetical protein